MDRTGQRPVILVGVNGSRTSLAALRWAVGEARRWDAELRVIQAWQRRPSRAFYAGGGSGESDGSLQSAAAEQLATNVHAALGDHTGADLAVELVCGSAERVLGEASAHADLLVLGSGSGGAVAQAGSLTVGRSVGPVIRACVHHARCPVVIVNPAMAEHQITAARDECAGHESRLPVRA